MDFDSYQTPQAESLLRSAEERHGDRCHSRRSLITEAVVAVLFLVSSGLFAVLAPWTRALSVTAVVVTTLAYLVAARVRFPVGSAWTAPTQLVFVPMLFVLPVPLVPVIVAACSVLDPWLRLRRRRMTLAAVLERLGDSFYSLGPAFVLVLAGHPGLSWRQWPWAVLLLAFVAQVVCDAAAGFGRTWFAERIAPSQQLQMGWLYVTDGCFSCAGLVIAVSAVGHPGVLLLVVPMIAWLSLFARERRQRLDRTVALSLGQAQRQVAERASLAKTEFLSHMSHELRTPLNAIIGFGEVLARSELDEQQSGDVEHIVRAGRHLLDLITDLLDVSRIESGHLRLDLATVRVADVIEEAVELIMPLASSRSTDIAAEVDDGWASVTADAQRLKQVLLNLLSNAVKYNRDGGLVSVRACRTADRVRITVSDDGPGIGSEMLAKAFQPFERLGAEQTAVEGTGLGLALCKGMVEAMGGTIAVESRSGHGTEFAIDLQAAAAAAAVPDEAEVLCGLTITPRRDAGGRRERCAVLSIEDDRSHMTLMEQIISLRPHVEMLRAFTGTIGLEMARERHPKLVLLDYNLPDVTGAEVLAQLKADPRTGAIPVVVVSADATPGQITRVLADGATAYLTKPLDVTMVLDLVDDVITPLLGAVA